MAVNESVEGVDSIAITGIAAGVSSLGLLGKGEAVGVRGESQKWHAVVGLNSGDQGAGVYSHSNGTGAIRKSKSWMGIYGRTHNTTGGAGLMGETQGSGVIGKSQTWMGVYGETPSTTGGAGVCGEHKANGSGVAGKSGGGAGVFGTSGTNRPCCWLGTAVVGWLAALRATSSARTAVSFHAPGSMTGGCPASSPVQGTTCRPWCLTRSCARPAGNRLRWSAKSSAGSMRTWARSSWTTR